MKNSFLRRTLGIIILTVILSAALSAVAFRYIGVRAYAGIKADELMPRASFLSEITALYLEGLISAEQYERTMASDWNVWDAEPYIYSGDGTLFVYPSKSQLHTERISAYLPVVLGGESVSKLTSGKMSFIMIGVPVVGAGGRILGALFLVKPVDELNTALNTLFIALGISMLLAAAIMLAPAYFVSRRLAEPLKRMNTAALAMAKGDFSVRASEQGGDEIAQLGSSLNYLSRELGRSINELILERNRLKAILDGLGEGVIAVDKAGAVIQHNPAASKLLGIGEGANLEASGLYLSSVSPYVTAVMAGEGEAESLLLKRGEMTLSVTAAALNGTVGDIEGAVILIRDVTEAERLEQTRRDYVANVSHELRTPLASIRSLSDALADGLIKTDADRARYYGHIQRESIRLSRLIDDLLELSRLQSGSVSMVKRRMSVEELVQEVADRYSTLGAESVRVDVEIPQGMSDAYSNADRAEQVLIALLDNALKHRSGGDIGISAADVGDAIEISVSNDGEIPDEDIGHIFERFYKSDKSHSGGGTGLGLSISKEIISLLGGRMSARSEGGRITIAFTLEKWGALPSENTD